jgi:L-amino acid N-acyltransferase YncA
MDDLRFEKLTAEHLQDILDIYAWYVHHSTATFHMHVPDLAEMKSMVVFEKPVHQAFVIFQGETLCGYVLLRPYRTREAYDGTAEVSVYLRHDHTGRGIGGRAVSFIEDFARARGFHVLIASICAENRGSIRLFKKHGYRKCARYRQIGRKFGRWLDVVDYQKLLD